MPYVTEELIGALYTPPTVRTDDGADEAREARDSQDPTLRNAFRFLGVTDQRFIHINNTSRGEDVTDGALAESRTRIQLLIAASNH